MNFRAPPNHNGGGPRARRSARTRDQSGVLSVPAFRRWWTALALSSAGDWLAVIALIALAPSLFRGHAAVAVGGVWLAALLPGLLLGPPAGALADRLDRRTAMIVGDVIRGLLILSIPLFPHL
ncbi:MAG TPA: MFS transporter, partial [Streptosporangiaceae bacterium]